jgi:AraC-like DNA-binding protein
MTLGRDNILPPPAAWRDASIHSVYVRVLIAVAERQGLRLDIRHPTNTGMLSFLDVVPWLDAMDVVRHPHQGLEIGAMVTAAVHGPLGLALVSAATVGQAMQTIARYAPMRIRLFDYRCAADKDETVLSLRPRFDLGGYRIFEEMATSTTFFRPVTLLAGTETARHVQLDVTWERKGEDPRPIPTRYGQAVTALRVPRAFAERAIVTADAKQYALACRACEAELDVMNGNLPARLRAIMPDEDHAWPSLEDAARRFAMSTRTLIRKLAAKDLTYQVLLDEAKGELAYWYLHHTALPMSDIAERLGFASTAGFSRSFKRLRGISPLAFRRS